MMSETQNMEYKRLWKDEYLKWICAFANAQGGQLLIGLDDDGTPVGLPDAKRLMEDIPNKIVNSLGIFAQVDLEQRQGKDIIAVRVSPSPLPVAYHGSYYQRSGATVQELRGAELRQFLLRGMAAEWDNMAQPHATFDDIDPAAVDYFQRMAIMNGRMQQTAYSSDLHAVLSNLDLLDGEGHPTNAALLTFGRRPSRWCALCDFRIGRFIHGRLAFQDAIEGDLIRMPDRIIEVLRSKHLTSPVTIQGLRRIEPLEIPEAVLREAILNAIIHKDYTGPHIQMKVNDSNVELWNYGSLPDGWTVETLLGPHASKPRNKHIAQVFYRAGFIENWGSGIGNIARGLQEAGLPQPIFSAHCGGMLLTLPRPAEVAEALEEERQSSKVDSKVSSKANVAELSENQDKTDTQGSKVSSKVSSKVNKAELTEKQKVVLQFCKTPHSSSEILKKIGVTNSTKSRKKYIHDLIALGLLVMTDPNSPRSPQQKYKTVTQ